MTQARGNLPQDIFQSLRATRQQRHRQQAQFQSLCQLRPAGRDSLEKADERLAIEQPRGSLDRTAVHGFSPVTQQQAKERSAPTATWCEPVFRRQPQHRECWRSIFEQWINPAAFFNPPAGTFGTSPRNAIAPGFADVDFSVVKKHAYHGAGLSTVPDRNVLTCSNRTNLATPSGTCEALSFDPSKVLSAANGHASVAVLGSRGITIGDFFGAPGMVPRKSSTCNSR